LAWTAARRASAGSAGSSIGDVQQRVAGRDEAVDDRADREPGARRLDLHPRAERGVDELGDDVTLFHELAEPDAHAAEAAAARPDPGARAREAHARVRLRRQ